VRDNFVKKNHPLPSERPGVGVGVGVDQIVIRIDAGYIRGLRSFAIWSSRHRRDGLGAASQSAPATAPVRSRSLPVAWLQDLVAGFRRGIRHLCEDGEKLVSTATSCSFLQVFLGDQSRQLFCHGSADELIDRNPILLSELAHTPVQRIRQPEAQCAHDQSSRRWVLMREK
jgi:hypothetical protein